MTLLLAVLLARPIELAILLPLAAVLAAVGLRRRGPRPYKVRRLTATGTTRARSL